MKIISHRGNLEGPQPNQENNPDYIDKAILEGFNVEIDVWIINNIGNTNKLYLGHDKPEYKISREWLAKRSNLLWVHCKNLQAAFHLSNSNLRCFGSEYDPFCFITNGYIWVNNTDIKPLSNCVVPLLGLEDIKAYRFMDSVYAVCTDYPGEL